MSDFFKITKLRLVNFHNIGTTTLDIKSGGHLFLLGDNGSGKTTVLDAIHFVLTGGRSMEFNSAARVVGAKTAGGRNIQGIVMRYNIETNGPMNPDGGISYAALEIETRNQRPVSIAVGVSSRSMDEAYESWGVVMDGSVDAMPLIHEEDGRQRPTTRQELKEVLRGNGFYGRIGAYTDDIATRFFDSRATYNDVCQLIATGKAYREIASRAGDYDKLFRNLLQEPQKDVFETLIRNLKSIEESKQNLLALKGKSQFVQGIKTKRDTVLDHRINSACARWLERSLAANEFRTWISTGTEFCELEKQRLADLTFQHENLGNEEERANLRLTELRQKDTQGLVSLERDARIAYDKANTEHNRSKSKLVQVKRAKSDADSDLEKSTSALVKQMQGYTAELQRLGRSLPFPTNQLSAFLDDASRSDTPENAAADMPVADLYEQADLDFNRIVRATGSAEKRSETLIAEIAAKQSAIDAKRRQEEAEPAIPCFSEARRAVREAMLDAFPLYEGLVPASDLRAREVAMLEQLIGDAILATWIVQKDDSDALRKTLFKNFPDHSLAVPDDDDDDTRCDWIGRFFDLPQSNPDAILVLRQQLAAKAGPHAEKFLEQNIVHFRNRETPVTLQTPRLIGLEARRDQLQREIRLLENERDALTRDRKSCEQELATLKAEQHVISSLKALLQNAPGALQRLSNEVNNARNVQTRCHVECDNTLDDLNRCEEDKVRAGERLDDIVLKLSNEGLDGLEPRIKEAERKLKSIKKEYDLCTGEISVVERKIKEKTAKIIEWNSQMSRVLDERNDAEADLLILVKPVETLDAFVSARCSENSQSREKLNQFSVDARVAAASIESDIRNALSLNENLSFGFVYDNASNKLTDRRGANIDDVIAETTKQLADQESIITEDTRRLFKQIIMDELMVSLLKNVMQLRSMTRKIALLLKGRLFGNNQYSFSISPADGFSSIIETVQRYRSLNPSETEAELKTFFDDHFAEILATEVGEVPQLLDYRNWFRYELKIITTNSEGQIIDRKVKGMGSGGEQAVPNYLLILMIANFLYDREKIRLPILVFDEAFYGIDANRRDQILAFASDLKLQLFVASPDQDGVKKEIPFSTSVLVRKDKDFNVHLYPYHWNNTLKQQDLLDPEANIDAPIAFGQETR